MTCKHLIGLCAKTHMPCPHCAVDGKCDEAACTNAVVPTWSELVDIYVAAAKPTKRRLANIKSSLHTLTRALGQSIDDKVTVTDEQIDAAYEKLKLDHEPESIEGIFNAVKATTSDRREIKMEFRKRGKQRPDIEMPTVEKRAKSVVQLDEAQRVAVREKITTLRLSKSPSDRARFLWMWFGWNFGMRPIDIGSIKWGVIKRHSNGSWWLDYVPTKTAKTGKHAGCKLSDTLVEEIRPFIGADDEFVIPRHDEKRPKSGCAVVKHGENAGLHATLRRYVIEFMKSIGVEDPKPQYAMRKDCSQRTIKTLGILHEAQMLAHTPKVAMTNYTDISKLELKEGL